MFLQPCISMAFPQLHFHIISFSFKYFYSVLLLPVLHCGCGCLFWFGFFLYIKSSEFLVLEMKHQSWNKYGLFMPGKQNSCGITRNIRSCLSGTALCKTELVTRKGLGTSGHRYHLV